MIRQRASAPRSKEQQRPRQQPLPQYHQYQQQQALAVQPQDHNHKSWEEGTWSTTNSGDLVDEELGGPEPDLTKSQEATLHPPPAVSNLPFTVQYPPQSSYYSALYFQIPDSNYREHRRKVRLPSSSLLISKNKTTKYRFLFFFSSPHALARTCGWLSLMAMIFLLFVGMLIDLQPLYMRGILPRETLMNAHARRKFRVLLPTSNNTSTRLDPAKHAYQAAFAYFVTLSVCWLYGYHVFERLLARVRRRHYRDIPDHPDDIHGNNYQGSEYHDNNNDDMMSNVATILAPTCSHIYSRSRRVCRWCQSCRNRGQSPLLPLQQQQQPQRSWQDRCLAFLWWWQRLLVALGDICWATLRRATSWRFCTSRRTTRRSRRTTPTAAGAAGNASSSTNTSATTATQRKRRKNPSSNHSNASQTPPVSTSGGTPATTRTLSPSSGKHKHG